MKKLSLTNQILIALVLGIILGVLINFQLSDNEQINYIVNDVFVGGVFTIIGNLFLNAIQMLVVPLVFVSIALGIAKMGDGAKVGRIGGKTILFYMSTTIFAIIIGLVIANVTDPGQGLDITNLATGVAPVTASESTDIVDTVSGFVPSNIFIAFINADMIQIIVFAVFFGIAITSLGDKVKKLHIILEELNDIFLRMLTILMKTAPIAVFSLIITTFSGLGIEAIIPIFGYVFTAIFAMFLHVAIVYTFILIVLGKVNPLKFFINIKRAMSFAFSTTSSAGTLPITKQCVEENCGVSPEISSFVLPIGSTINMDGTAIMQGAAIVFIAQASGIDLSIADYISVIITATLASVGTAGVPGSGVIMLSMVVTQVGLPIEGVAIIMGVDRIVDMARTVVNVTGDAVCSLVVARSENAINDKVFNSEPKF